MLSSNRISLPHKRRKLKAVFCYQLRGKRSSVLSREAGRACLLCWDEALFCVTTNSQSLLVKDEVEDFSVWKLRELCTLLLCARFLQVLSARKKYSWFPMNNLNGTLLVVTG